MSIQSKYEQRLKEKKKKSKKSPWSHLTITHTPKDVKAYRAFLKEKRRDM